MTTTANLPIITMYGAASVGKTSLISVWKGERLPSPEEAPVFQVRLPSGHPVLIRVVMVPSFGITLTDHVSKADIAFVVADLTNESSFFTAERVITALGPETKVISILNKVDQGIYSVDAGFINEIIVHSHETFLTSTIDNTCTTYPLASLVDLLTNVYTGSPPAN